jgi:hypothetical protein
MADNPYQPPFPQWMQDACEACREGIPLRFGYREGHDCWPERKCTAPSLRERLELVEKALVEIRDARAKWIQGVGSYAGGETYAGFAYRLQQIARSAMPLPALSEDMKRRGYK